MLGPLGAILGSFWGNPGTVFGNLGKEEAILQIWGCDAQVLAILGPHIQKLPRSLGKKHFFSRSAVILALGKYLAL